MNFKDIFKTTVSSEELVVILQDKNRKLREDLIGVLDKYNKIREEKTIIGRENTMLKNKLKEIKKYIKKHDILDSEELLKIIDD